jgi:methionine aminopeptidase
MIEILNSTELPRAREAGALVAGILQTLKSRCEVGTNLRDINLWAQAMITEAGAQSCYVDYEPSFGRGPFGHYIRTSVNDAVLHGLPQGLGKVRVGAEEGCTTGLAADAGSWQTRGMPGDLKSSVGRLAPEA